MIRESVIKKTEKIFRDIFDSPSLVLHENMSAQHIDNWDSLNHINLLSAIQQEFKIKFELKEIQELRNVGSIVDLILKKTRT